MQDVLKIIADEMDALKINYEFERWTDEVFYPYFVGEYTEVEGFTEDGLREVDFILTGTTRGTWAELEECRAKIEKNFPPIEGKAVSTTGGAIVAIFYASALPVPTDEESLKRIQVNLTVKEWRVF